MQHSNFHYCKTYEDLSREISEYILVRLKEYGKLHLGLATGQSPKMAYQIIGHLLSQNPALIPGIRIFQLDEWLGLSGNNTSSCQHYLYQNVIRHWQLTPGQYFLLDGQHSDMEQQLNEMRDHLNKNPLDICILGMGKNGHLAFNEPGSTVSDGCRIVPLANSSKTHQMIEGLKTQLEKGITIGLKEILASNELLLIVSGEGKEEACKQLLNRSQIETFPASAVYDHPNYKIYLDQKKPT